MTKALESAGAVYILQAFLANAFLFANISKLKYSESRKIKYIETRIKNTSFMSQA